MYLDKYIKAFNIYLIPIFSQFLINFSAQANLKEAIEKGDLFEIFSSVEKGENLNDEKYPAIFEIVSHWGIKDVQYVSRQNTFGSFADDLHSGLFYSIDKKIVLIQYLKAKGAKIDTKLNDSQRVASGSAAIHAADDPRIMATLLDLGANPLLRDKRGNQVLINFIDHYKKYPNKEYFRLVLKRILEAGANVDECFPDGSGCLLDIARKTEDQDLYQLFLSYRR
jgi:hypothetical protein